MADRPILFSAPMVRALLAGTKMQTRRALKFQPAPGISIIRKTIRPIDANPYHSFERRSVYGNYAGELDIKIKRGDRLWVRESGYLLREAHDHDPVMREDVWRDAGFQHSADDIVVPIRPYDPPINEWIDDCSKTSRPSIHMPRWASRLTLTVTDVRVERLQDISEQDAKAEGAVPYHCAASKLDTYGPSHAMCGQDRRAGFCKIWETINGIESWDANPWVVAYTFTVERGNLDQIAQASP